MIIDKWYSDVERRVDTNRMASDLYNKIVDSYLKTGSIKTTAQNLGTYPIKVRRVLLTEGLWSSKTSKAIAELLDEGKTVAEIADILCVTEKAVQSLIPYTKGEYNLKEKSKDAIRSEEYRDRMVLTLDRQVGHTERSTKLKIIKNGQEIKVMKLMLELNTKYANMDILKKYGRVKNGITREVLVPSDITLHALNYAIQKAFGWQNSHLHCFKLHDDVFDSVTEKSLIKWADMCGLYFRFPNEERKDEFWDDDYQGNVSIKTWLKQKYTGPYFYGGITENVYTSSMEALTFIRSNEKLEVAPPFAEYLKNKDAKGHVVDIDKATTDDLKSYFMPPVDELIERLTVSEILFPEGGKVNMSDLDKLIKRKKELLVEVFPEYIETIGKVNDIKENKKLSEYKKEALIWQLINEGFYPLIDKCNIQSIPVTDKIKYEYDFGDNWEVNITCQGIYDQSENEDTQSVISEYKPLCTAIDGLPVCDDTGGIHGYTEMLNSIHGIPSDTYEYKDADGSRVWARSMGWTGRMPSPGKLF